MSTAPTALLGDSAPADTARADSRVLHRAGLWVMLAANVLAAWGVQWDIQWHVQIGRDSFWIPPHVMTYAGVTLIVLGAFGVLAIDTLRRLVSGREPAGADRIFGITSTPGFHLAAWGIALAVLAAPIDDLWHRLFGLDVTLWSPPHLLGLLGVAINTMACAVIAREAYPAGRVQLGTVIFALATFYGTLGIGLRESGRIAYVHGGVLFYTFSILGALLLPLALVTAARLTGRRWAPIAVLAIVIVLGLIGATIARVGFEIIQPVSVIEEEIAKDPTSPVAVGFEIARKNGTAPGAPVGGTLTRILAFVPVLILIAIDPQRRLIPATLAYGLGLLGFMGLVIGRTPAFEPMVPGLWPTAAALVLTLATAFAGAMAAHWLCDRLSQAAGVPAQPGT
jgi:hypothetical protein